MYSWHRAAAASKPLRSKLPDNGAAGSWRRSRSMGPAGSGLVCVISRPTNSPSCPAPACQAASGDSYSSSRTWETAYSTFSTWSNTATLRYRLK